jgi:hypothetical protein
MSDDDSFVAALERLATAYDLNAGQVAEIAAAATSFHVGGFARSRVEAVNAIAAAAGVLLVEADG